MISQDNTTIGKSEYRFAWVEWVKAIALIWIFLNHTAERVFGYPLISNPTADWPPITDRIAQLAPLQGYGINAVLVNLFRYAGWFGDQGVQLFLIISGFGLTWGLLNRGHKDTIPLKNFYIQRLARIYPLWWGAHFIFFAAWLIMGRGLPFTEIESWLSFLGLRITPALFYYFSPAWWYFALILQLYLVFPFLWTGLRRLGAARFFLAATVVSVGIRAIGLLVFTGYLDVWQRGGIFITRLPEFAFGMALAAWMYENPRSVRRYLTSPKLFLAGVVVYSVGLVFSLDLLGMALAPFLLGVGAFVVFFNLLERLVDRIPSWLNTAGVWIGVHSYSLYLMHHPVISRLIPEEAAISLSLIRRMALAVVATLVLALLLEYIVAWVVKTVRKNIQATGVVTTSVRIAATGFLMASLLLLSEFLVRKISPQEIFGWGERPSLEINDEFGWRLIPGSTTRLRWQSYDYTVSANSLGFPGPEYPVERLSGTKRILVTGDAFSSAEGVNTESAWPRILETDLAQRLGESVEVMNFAITGYGPNQYAAVIEKFVPVYKPDLVLVELFVNDFEDALWTNEQFQQSIGFFEPSQSGLYSYLRLEHLRSFLRYDVFDPLSEYISNNPQTKGYFLGGFRHFEKWREEELVQASNEVELRLREIYETVHREDSSLLVVVVPAPVQVCAPGDLAYYPRHVDFSNPEQYNPELPQKLFFEIGNSLGIPFIDLRDPLRQAVECPYQARNLHWTEHGNELVAAFLADYIFQTMPFGDAP